MVSLATWALLATTVAYEPLGSVVCDRVDLMEVNHYYDERGRLVFQQVIFYDWHQDHGRFGVRDWRVVKKPGQIPHKSGDGNYVVVWNDAEQGNTLRKVYAPAITYTWTQYDPELVNREFIPKDHRRRLARIRK